MQNTKFPHLNFTDWPFQTVPDEHFFNFMADRKEVKEDVYKILRFLSRRETSSIHLLWAWYGAGKSHTLKHMKYLCSQQYPSLLAVYTEFPESARSFLDVYKAMILGVKTEWLKKAYEGLIQNQGKIYIEQNIANTFIDFSKALELISYGGSEHRVIAERWLRGERVHVKILRGVGLSKRIETPIEAIKSISCIVNLIKHSTQYHRILWMIDEFQRIGLCRDKNREDIHVGLHTTFNNCPSCLSLFLSFSVRMQKNMISLLSRELIDRIGIQKGITIPPLTKEDAMIFIIELFVHFRMKEKTSDKYFPFEKQSIKWILKRIEENSELKPRTIMQYFNAVLEEADTLIEDGEIKNIGIDFAKSVLEKREVELLKE